MAEQKWIVGVDMSTDSLHGLRWAAANAREGVSIKALLALEPAYFGLVEPGGVQLPVPSTDVEEVVLANLESGVADVAELRGQKIASGIAIGPPSPALLDASADADLVVVGNRGRGGFASLMLGSVSSQVSNHSTVPTAVIPLSAPVARSTRIVVGVDGSDNAAEALRWACSFASPDADITAVGVWKPPFTELEVPRKRPLESPRDIAKSLFSDTVDAISADFGGRKIRRHFVTGNPRHALVDPELEADLVVVGARGYDGLQGALIGSVATWVLHHSKCATVIVPGTGT